MWFNFQDREGGKKMAKRNHMIIIGLITLMLFACPFFVQPAETSNNAYCHSGYYSTQNGSLDTNQLADQGDYLSLVVSESFTNSKDEFAEIGG